MYNKGFLLLKYLNDPSSLCDGLSNLLNDYEIYVRMILENMRIIIE